MGSNNDTRFSIVLLGEDKREYYCLKQPLKNVKPFTLIENLEFLIGVLDQGWLCVDCSDSSIFSFIKTDKETKEYFQFLHEESGDIDFISPINNDSCTYSIFINSIVLSDMKIHLKNIESELLLADLYFLNEKQETVFEASNFYDGMWADSYCFSLVFPTEVIMKYYRNISHSLDRLRKIDSPPYIESIQK